MIYLLCNRKHSSVYVYNDIGDEYELANNSVWHEFEDLDLSRLPKGILAASLKNEHEDCPECHSEWLMECGIMGIWCLDCEWFENPKWIQTKVRWTSVPLRQT